MDQPAARALERLAARAFDLLVIGGGIVGAGIAEAAARTVSRSRSSTAATSRGATSSASSKLIHGGLRYLRLGDVRLVREAHHERRALMRVVAPHLVRRLPFLFPLYDGRPVPAGFVQSGICSTRRSRGAKLNGLVEPERARTARARSCAPTACARARSTRTRGRTTAG